MNRKPVIDENSRNVEEIVISLEERQELLNKFIKIIKYKFHKIEHCKIYKSLNDSTVSKFVTRKWIERMVYQAVNVLSTRI